MIVEMMTAFFLIEIYFWNIKPRMQQRLTVYILLIVEIVTEWKWQINNISMTYWCMWKSIFMKIMYSFLVNLLAVIFNRGNRNVFSLQTNRLNTFLWYYPDHWVNYVNRQFTLDMELVDTFLEYLYVAERFYSFM